MQSPSQENSRAIVVQRHVATDGAQLALEVDDIVYVLERDETGWWGGHKEYEETTGWFPGSCVRVLEDGEEALATSSVLGDTPGGLLEAAADTWGDAVQVVDNVQDTQVERVVPLVAEEHDILPEQSPPVEEELDVTKQETISTTPPKGAECLVEETRRRLSNVPSPTRVRRESDTSQKATSILMNTTPVEVETSPATQSGHGHSHADHAESEFLMAKNSQLKQELQEMTHKYDHLRRQSDADKHRLTSELESVLQQGKQCHDDFEQKYALAHHLKVNSLADNDELKRQLEAAVQDLEKARQKAAADEEEKAAMASSCQMRFQEFECEMRSIQETSRKSMQNEKKLQDELEACRQEVESVKKQSRASLDAVDRAVSNAATASDEVVPRRLFPSGPYAIPDSSPMSATGREAGGVARQLFDPCNAAPDLSPSFSPAGSPVSDYSRGRQPGAMTPHAPPPTPEKHPAISGSSRPTPQRSTSLNRSFPTGSSSQIRCGSHTPATEEAPKAGLVRELSLKMEKRVEGLVSKRNASNPPVRGPSPAASSRTAPRDVRGRNSRDGSARTPPMLPKTMPPPSALLANTRPLLTYGLDDSLTDEPDEHYDLGMSPLVRVQPSADQGAQQNCFSAALAMETAFVPVGAGPSTVPFDAPAAEPYHPEAATSEVSVRQRIKHFKQRIV